MTNKEVAEHFASLPPEETASVNLYHCDSADLRTGEFRELTEEDLKYYPPYYSDHVGEVVVDVS